MRNIGVFKSFRTQWSRNREARVDLMKAEPALAEAHCAREREQIVEWVRKEATPAAIILIGGVALAIIGIAEGRRVYGVRYHALAMMFGGVVLGYRAVRYHLLLRDHESYWQAVREEARKIG
jgi:hypothetical protein